MPRMSKKTIEFLNNIYLISLHKYYDNLEIEKIKEIKNIISGNFNISLRLLDWFVTKYTKSNMILLKTNKEDEEEQYLNVFISYKSQLKSYTKKFFDPFKRQPIVNFKFNDSPEEFKTTVGQLLFFKWMYENNIIDYVKQNTDLLYEKMYIFFLNDKKKKLNKSIQKSDKQKKYYELHYESSLIIQI